MAVWVLHAEGERHTTETGAAAVVSGGGACGAQAEQADDKEQLLHALAYAPTPDLVQQTLAYALWDQVRLPRLPLIWAHPA